MGRDVSFRLDLSSPYNFWCHGPVPRDLTVSSCDRRVRLKRDIRYVETSSKRVGNFIVVHFIICPMTTIIITFQTVFLIALKFLKIVIIFTEDFSC